MKSMYEVRTEEAARLERRLYQLGQTPKQVSEALRAPLPTVLCGNERHPHGPWHEAAPLCFSWDFLGRFMQWCNQRRWGCACDRRAYADGARAHGPAMN